MATLHSNDKCGKCDEEVLTGQKALACDDCDKWYHISCENLTNPVYKIFSDKETDHLWFCINCRSGVKTKIRNLVKENSNLTAEVQQLNVKIKTLEIETENGKNKVTTEKKNKVMKDVSTMSIEMEIPAKASKFGPGIEWKVQKGGKVSSVISKEFRLPIKNKYDILNLTKAGEVTAVPEHIHVREAPSLNFPEKKKQGQNDNKGTVLIGDSIIRKMDREFVAINPKNRKRRCLPGAKMKTIIEVCKEEINITGSETIHIVSAGGNDIASDRQTSSEIMAKYSEIMKLYKDNNRKLVLVEILPRPSNSEYLQDYTYCTNQKLKNACLRYDLPFIETWDLFNDYSLYKRDGVHLNDIGCVKLGNILNDAVKKIAGN